MRQPTGRLQRAGSLNICSLVTLKVASSSGSAKRRHRHGISAAAAVCMAVQHVDEGCLVVLRYAVHGRSSSRHGNRCCEGATTPCGAPAGA